MTIEFYFKSPSRTSVLKFLIYALLIGNLCGIIFIWFNNSSYYIKNPAYGNIWIALGRLTGLLGAYIILIQLMLVGRTRWIEESFGFDKMNKVHRWMGYSILLFLVGHPVLLILGYSRANEAGYISQLADFLANWHGVLNAFFALLLFMFVVLFSVAIIRRKFRYETWYFVHLATYVAIVLAFNHQVNSGDLARGSAYYYWYALTFFAGGSILLYRFIRPLFLFARHRFTVEKVVQETPDVWSLYITGRNLQSFKFKAGQYCNLTILSCKMWYTHPFSFSSAYNSKYIRFSIKSLGDYTSEIKSLVPGTKIILDGPYGVFISTRAIRPKLLCIAGGIGITPIRAMLEELSVNGTNTVLLYGSRSRKDIVFFDELEQMASNSKNIRIRHILGIPEENYDSGNIDKEKIVRLVPDFFEREVFICGPPSMMKAVLNNLHDLGIPSGNIHFEKFSF